MIVALILIVLCPISVFAQDLSTFGFDSSLRHGLVAYWPLDEGGGTRYDRTHNGNHVNPHNTPEGVAGIVAGCCNFRSASFEYLSNSAPVNLGMNGKSCAVSAWVNLTTLPTSGNSMAIAGKWDGGTTTNFEYLLFVFNNAGSVRFRFIVRNPAGTTFDAAIADTFGDVPTNTWCWVYGCHTNGVGLAISVNNGSLDTQPHTDGIRNGTAAWTIGAQADPAAYFNGAVDEVAVWNRTLTSGERTQAYGNGLGTTFQTFRPFSWPLVSAQWVPNAGNPILSPTLGFEGSYCRDPYVLFEGAGDYKMWYWGNNQNLGYAISVDGIAWTKVSQINIGGGRPCVIHQGGLYYLFTNDNTNILVSTCSTANGTFTVPSVVLSPSASWESGALKVPSVIFDSGDSTWKMWYSAGSYTPNGVSYTEPLKVGYATSSSPTNGWSKYSGNPILTPQSGTLAGGAIQALEVAKDSGIFNAVLSGADQWGIDRLFYITSTTETNWDLSTASMIMAPGPVGSYKKTFVYGKHPVNVSGIWNVWFTGRNDNSGIESMGLTSH